MNRRLVKNMTNQKIAKVISRIASGFGVIFVIFAALSAFITYEAISIQSSGFIPSDYLQVNILNAMLPYLLYAVLSFVVAGVTSRAARESAEEEAHPTLPEPQLTETQVEESKP